MSPKSTDSASGTDRRISELIQDLHRTEDQLYELAGENVDAILDPEGKTVFLRHAREALQSSEKRFRTLAESMPMIVWTANAHGQVDYASSALYAYVGASPDEDPGTGWQAMLHPDDLERCLAQWSDCVREGKDFEIEYRLYRASDQTYRWHLVRAVPIRGEDGRIAKWYGTATEIEELVRLQTESNEMAQRLNAILESITDAFCTVDRDFRFTYLNTQAEALFGKPRKTLLGSVIWDACKLNPSGECGMRLQRAAETGEPTVFETHFEGTGVWLDLRVFPSAMGLTIHLRDITERRKEQEQLRLLNNCVAQLNDSVVITKADPLDEPGPEIVFVNPAFERLSGYKASEVVGRNPRFQQGPKTSVVATQRMGKALRAGESIREEVVNYSKDGREHWLEIAIEPVRDSEGTITHFVAVKRDVTQRKRLEESSRRSQRLESLGTLAGGIAHDLNNLLTPVLMGAELLQEFDLPEQAADVAREIQRSAERGAQIVRQVLTFSRGAPGQIVAISIPGMLKNLESFIQTSFPKNIVFQFHIVDDLWPLAGDPVQLEQLLVNLSINARDAMPKGGDLKIAVRNQVIDTQFAAMTPDAKPGDFVVVQVSDTGIGMSQDIREHIFEPFFTTKPIGHGTGLGLSTAIGVVRSHGGFIQVYSEPGKGSTFRIYLPRQTKPSKTTSAPFPLGETPKGSGETILVVDDEETILKVTQKTLEANGYNVMTAQDAADAIGIYAREKDTITAVLTDIRMPEMDGHSLIAVLRRMNPNLPIVAASGLDANEVEQGSGGPPLELFLIKPYSAETLLRMVAAAVAKASTSGSTPPPDTT